MGEGLSMAKSMYMVVEYFKNKDAIAVCRRFRDHGRLAPEGLLYISSWVDNKLEHDRTLRDEGMENWSDLVDFEVHPVHRTKRQTKSRHDYSSHRRNDPSVLATECNHLTISLTVSVLIDRVTIPRSSVVAGARMSFTLFQLPISPLVQHRNGGHMRGQHKEQAPL